jgi:hypothetical protein
MFRLLPQQRLASRPVQAEFISGDRQAVTVVQMPANGQTNEDFSQKANFEQYIALR